MSGPNAGCLVVIGGHTTQLKDYDDLISLFFSDPTHKPISMLE